MAISWRKTGSFGTKKGNFGVMEGPNASLFGLKNSKNENGNFFSSIQVNHMILKWFVCITLLKSMEKALTSDIFM